MTPSVDPRRAVAILGMGVRFPGGATTPDAFWRMLLDGRDAVGEIPSDRVDVTRLYDPRPATPGRMMSRFGGFLDGIDRFDPGFFAVSPREAERMDPQQRLLLETAWEAVEHAGIDAGGLRGGQVGVYVGQWISDFEARLLARPERVDFEMTTGSGRYATAARLSYFLGLQGPSLSIDTACSSGLTAVHLAVQSLRLGETDLAFAGGVNVILSPHISVGYSQSRMMAPDGRCKFGDADGDGYVRSEGAATFLLKRLDRALSDGDRVLATIAGSAINNDGSSSGRVGRPGRAGQRALLERALADAGLPSDALGYVEAHGTGTAVGDPVELGALGEAIGRHRPASKPLLVGSVKTNLGHTEGAAGMAGLAKAALIARNGTIPPSLHVRTPNPKIDWTGDRLRLTTTATAVDDAAPAIGVSSYGVGGSNGHVILVPGPAAAGTDAPVPVRQIGARIVLPLSAATEPALRALASAYAAFIDAHPETGLDRIAAAAARRRTGLVERAVFVAEDRADICARLRAFAAGDDADIRGAAGAGSRRVVFVAPGQGGQWAGMARDLMRENEAFRTTIEACDAALDSLVDWSLAAQLAADPEDPDWRLDRIEVIQPVLTAVTLAYAAAWRALGVEPDAVIGHSMGEAAAAAIAGALTGAEAFEVVVRRSALMARTRGQGGMALVELPSDALAARLADYESRLSVAAQNGPRSAVVTGETAALDALLGALEGEGVFCRRIKVDVASHSPQMAPLADELAASLADRLEPAEGTVPVFSTVTGDRIDGRALDAGYWARNLREPVEFHGAVTRAREDGDAVFVELGAHPVLLPSIRDCLRSVGAPQAAVASGHKEVAGGLGLVSGFGALWAHGGRAGWATVYPEAGPVIDLPRYPWQRGRFWTDAARMRGPDERDDGAAPLEDGVRDKLCRIAWRRLEPAAAPSSEDGVGGEWLVLAGREEAAAEAADRLRDLGFATRGATPDTLGAVDAAPERVLALCPQGADAPYWPVRVWQAIRRRGWAPPQQLVLVTRGATAPRAARGVDTFQAAQCGTGRVLAEEAADCAIRLVDREVEADGWADLGAELVRTDGETEVALRGGDRFAPRLTALNEEAAQGPDPARGPWRRDAACLITGGLGGVGLRIARGLALSGARHLILLGRTGLPPRETWRDLAEGTRDARCVAAIREIEAAGASVELAAVAVDDEAAMTAFVARRDAEARPPIRSVVHGAATAGFDLIDRTDEASFACNLGAKLEGCRVLDRVFPDLDTFVAFSSVADVIGEVGAAGYAAANAGLEAVVANRRARGQTAICIAWGPWKDVGIMTHSVGETADEELARLGLRASDPDEAVAIFEWLVRRATSAVVLDVDWDAFARARSGRLAARFGEIAEPARAATDTLALSAATPEARQAALLDLVRHALGAVLKQDAATISADAPLGGMGLNSVMALNLRNRLEDDIGRPLPATLAWNYPTAAALAHHLAGLVATGGDAGEADRQASTDDAGTEAGSVDDFLQELAGQSDEDVAASLRAARTAGARR